MRQFSYRFAPPPLGARVSVPRACFRLRYILGFSSLYRDTSDRRLPPTTYPPAPALMVLTVLCPGLRPHQKVRSLTFHDVQTRFGRIALTNNEVFARCLLQTILPLASLSLHRRRLCTALSGGCESLRPSRRSSSSYLPVKKVQFARSEMPSLGRHSSVRTYVDPQFGPSRGWPSRDGRVRRITALSCEAPGRGRLSTSLPGRITSH